MYIDIPSLKSPTKPLSVQTNEKETATPLALCDRNHSDRWVPFTKCQLCVMRCHMQSVTMGAEGNQVYATKWSH